MARMVALGKRSCSATRVLPAQGVLRTRTAGGDGVAPWVSASHGSTSACGARDVCATGEGDQREGVHHVPQCGGFDEQLVVHGVVVQLCVYIVCVCGWAKTVASLIWID